MKLTHNILLLALTMANGFYAVAQSNDVPGDTDYSAFTGFITQRNIFDPNRYPHESRTYRRPPRIRSNSAPSFALVGTMTYQKGDFAFFSGNSDELKKILPLSGNIAGYAVTEINLTGVKLRGTDNKEIHLHIGDQMREENNGWQLVAEADVPAGPGPGENPASGGGNSGSGAVEDSSLAAPSVGLSNNDVLKRLMQLREQENK